MNKREKSSFKDFLKFFLATSLFVALLLFNPSKGQADTLTLHPIGKSGAVASVGTWTFTGGTDITALDSNDGDTSYVTDSAVNDKLYMNMDTTNFGGWTINSVQVLAIARCVSCNTGITLGLRVGSADSDRMGSGSTVRSASYNTFSGSLYQTNPKTGTAWQWSDVNSLIAIISHSSSGNAIRVTELFIQVNYTKVIYPAGKDPLSSAGWVYTPAGTEATALASNDGDSTYAQSSTQGDNLYLDFSHLSLATSTITGVQLNVYSRCITLPCNLQVGLRTNGTDFLTSFSAVAGNGQLYSNAGGTSVNGTGTNFINQLGVGSVITANGQTRNVTAVSSDNSLTVDVAFNPPLSTDRDFAVPYTFQGGTTSYQNFKSAFYQQNPATLAFWTWSDINSIMGVVNHASNNNGLRVTQAFLTISYINPVVLSYTPDIGYGSTKGVNPDSGSVTTPFTYKIVYTNLNNNAPTSIKVYIDNDGGHTMVPDASAQDTTFRDLNYVNGEQYVYIAPTLAQGFHNYYFSASDATDSAQAPSNGSILPGPGISVPSGTLTLTPSLEYPGTVGVWTFVGGPASTALSTNDGDTSYVENAPTQTGEYLYLTMTGSGLTGPTITSVQVSAALCDAGGGANAAIGLHINGKDYVSTSIAIPTACSSYSSFSPTSAFFSLNPDTGKEWTWQEINNILGVVLNSTSPVSSGCSRGCGGAPPPPGFRVTQFLVSVSYTPVGLSFPPTEAGYITNGVSPDSGNNSTSFIYKTVYTNGNGTAPGSACSPAAPKVYIDGDAGHCMTLDPAPADPTLNDGNYINGEQYYYTATGLANGTHNYYFNASDTATPANSVRYPITATFTGPFVSLPAGSFTLFPANMASGTNGWTFCPRGEFRDGDCFDPTTALDTNDGDNSYAISQSQDNFSQDTYLYMSMNAPLFNGQYINSVQVKGVLRDGGAAASFTLGVYNVASLSESPVMTTPGNGSYATYTGSLYGINPMTSAPWTWSDLNNLVAVIHHSDNNDLLVTQLYVVVNYGPLYLQNSQEANYVIRGVSPTFGNATTSFTFKVVYTQINNVAPAGACVPTGPKVYIDGDAGHCMVKDTTSAPALQNGIYSDGEQYLYTTLLSQGSHRYNFDATDGTNTSRWSLSSPGTGTISSSGTTVTGAGTRFTTDLKVGSTIIASGQNRLVSVILSDTSLTASSAFSPNLGGGSTFSYAQDFKGLDVALNGGASALHPTGQSTVATTTGWTFSGGSAGTALGSNDGDSSYARSVTAGDHLYMNIASPTLSTIYQITSVQLTAVARHVTSATNFDLGFRLGLIDFLSGAPKTTTGSYAAYSGLVYTFNPVTLGPWTWNDLSGLIGTVVHLTNNNEIRMTEFYLTVNYSPIQLSYPTDPQYFDHGVAPNGGTAATPFTYRIVYTQAFNLGPGAACSPPSPKVYIDGDAGHCMQVDSTAAAALQDGNFANSEEYAFPDTLAAQGAPHNYYFDVSDINGNTLRIPTSGTLSGPVVSAFAPTLSFANQTGYAVRSPGTGTLTSPGTCLFPNNVTGTGTAFTTQLQVGNTMTAAGGQTVTVTAISSDTCLTTDTPFTPNLANATFTYPTWSGGGTLSNASNSTTVTGTGTSFLTQLQIGSLITAGGQTHTVTAIASATSLTTDMAFSPNLSGASYAFYTDPALRGVEPNLGTINTPFTYKIVYTDADNNPPQVGPRLLLDYNTTVYLMSRDVGTVTTGVGTISSSGATVTGSGTSFLTDLIVGDTITASGQTKTVTAIASAASLTVNSAFGSNLPLGTAYTHNGLSDGVYTNGEQYTVTITIPTPGTHAYSFDVFDGVNTTRWPLNGDGYLSPSVTDSIVSGILIYPAGRNFQTSGFTFQGSDQDPTTALGAGYAGNGTITTSGTTVTGPGTNLSIMSAGGTSLIMSAGQTQVVNTIASDTSLTTLAAFSPTISTPANWLFDGDFSYASASRDNDRLYMNMTQVGSSTAVITSVQFFAWVRDRGNQVPFSVGLQIGGSNYTTSYTTGGNSAYSRYAGSFYSVNPKTGAAWTWNDINAFVGVVINNCGCGYGDHDNYYDTREIRVTQMYIQVKTNSLPVLSYSPEGGYYGVDGVSPDGAGPTQPFTYKVVFASAANLKPVFIKVFIDGDAGHDMIHDGGLITNDPLRNGDYTDGEQFYYTTAPNQLAVGLHNYYFQASDGTNTFRLPATTLPGPNVSIIPPVLSFSPDTAYQVDGVNPNSGQSAATQFVYKVVYTQTDNNRPLYVKVHIDGDSGRLMTPDPSAIATLRDGSYANGEQYTYTTSLPLGNHTYYFEATTGLKQVFLPFIPSSGVFSAPTVFDTSRPSAIANLAISFRGVNSTTLTWTAPGNDSTSPGCPCGTVVSYNIRYSTLQIIDDGITPVSGQINFSNATAVSNLIPPQSASATETFNVTNLNPNTAYYFAIKSVDEVPLTSLLSNIVNSGNNPPIPSTSLLAGSNMVSIPMTPSPATVDIVFGASVGTPAKVNKWVSTGLTNSSGSMVPLLATDIVQPGVGYFLSSPDGVRFLNPAGNPIVTPTFTLSLQQGWNMIGNPYTKDINLQDTCVSRNGASTATPCTALLNQTDYKSFTNAQLAGWPIGNALYSWNGVNYTFAAYDGIGTPKAALKLWQAHWLILTVNDATYKLIIIKP